MADRLAQIKGHLTNTYESGLLNGEVVIVTGKDPRIMLRCFGVSDKCLVEQELLRFVEMHKAVCAH